MKSLATPLRQPRKAKMNRKEFNSFIQVWGFALLSLTYAYQALSLVPHGGGIVVRLLSIAPVIAVLIFLPLRLTTLHLAVPTFVLFFWIANSKLLLLAFHRGPLADSPNLLNFLVVAALPIKLSSSSIKSPPPCYFRRFLLLLKVLLLGCIIESYDYRPNLHPVAIYVLLCVHLYLELEIVMKLYAMPAMVLLRHKLEPQFDEPYLATSLQDFWGQRWNLTVTAILRSTVYDPIRQAFARSTVVGKEAARVVATLATFLVSGVMHEFLYVYMTRVRPTWEVTSFFMLHGVCVVAEVEVKRRVHGRWRLIPAVSRVMTLGFVGSTGVWLFFPQLVRNGVVERVLAECMFGLHFVKEVCLFT